MLTTILLVLSTANVPSASAPASRGATVNLAVNSGFEQADPAMPDRPAGFTPGHVGKNKKARLTWEAAGRAGGRCVAVETTDSDDAGYWETVVPVKPETSYEIGFHYQCLPSGQAKASAGEAQYNQGRPGGPNLELGVVPDDPAQLAKPTAWSDIGAAMPPVGGVYAPAVAEWSSFTHVTRTLPGQTRMRLKLRVLCYAQKAWFDDLGVRELHSPVSRAATMQASGWTPTDTTPPRVFAPRPLPNAAAERDATISAGFADAGSGIDAASLRVTLDGQDATARAQLTHDGVSLRPAQSLVDGPHRVEVSVSDKAGNRSNHLAWQFGVGRSPVNWVQLRRGQFVVNDRPTFPRGIYSYQCHPGDGRFDETALAEAADAGITFVLNTIETEAGLNKLFEHGVGGMLNVSHDIKGCADPASARAALLDKGQARFRNHPCVLGYWADDPENADNTDGTPIPAATLPKLENLRQTLRQADPAHPLAFAISNLPRLGPSVPYCDVLLSYRYPVPAYHPQLIYGWTLHTFFSLAKGKPVWFNSQATDLGYAAQVNCRDEFRPTPAEMRVMAWYSIIAGAQGHTFYANEITRKGHPAHWREILRTASEIGALEAALVHGAPAQTASLADPGGGQSIFFRETVRGGEHTLLAANLSAGVVPVKWMHKRPVQAAAVFEDRRMASASDEMPDLFAPWEVHVYRWSE